VYNTVITVGSNNCTSSKILHIPYTNQSIGRRNKKKQTVLG
jgi:hypothetical protein